MLKICKAIFISIVILIYPHLCYGDSWNLKTGSNKAYTSLDSIKKYSDLTGYTIINNHLPLSVPPKSDSTNSFHANIEVQGIVTTHNVVPFWMRANQYGSAPLDGVSSAVTGRLWKEYSPLRNQKLLDWGAGFETRVNVGRQSEIILIEGFAKARLGIFQIKAGRSKDRIGLADSTLSVGSFALSGNSLGIPKVELSIPEYWTLPIFNDLIAIKGNFSYGWFGKTYVNPYVGKFERTEIVNVQSAYHQKSFYGRFGKPLWRLKLYAGFNHQTMFGNENLIFKDFNLKKLQSFLYAVTGKTWHDKNDHTTKLGNQIGSIDLGFTYDFKKVSLFLYRQQFYDVGALAYLANIRDGLTGIRVENRKNVSRNFGWNKVLLELFSSKNQAGEIWSKETPSGDEDYYNNFMYNQGWSYKGLGIGNPFITTKRDARKNLPSKEGQYFINNRVHSFHFSTEAFIYKVTLIAKLSYSKNFGTFGTSATGTSTGGIYSPPSPPYFPKLSQSSGFFEANTMLKNGYRIGLVLAVDHGKLLYNSTGASIKVSKTW